MFFKCARDRSQWSRRPGMIHRLLRAVDKVPCAKHCRWRWPAVSCAAAARSRRAQLALCRRHALDRTGKQSWHAAAEPYTPHGNGLDETSTAAMEAVLRHGKPEKISPLPRHPTVLYRSIYSICVTYVSLGCVCVTTHAPRRAHAQHAGAAHGTAVGIQLLNSCMAHLAVASRHASQEITAICEHQSTLRIYN